MATPITPEGLRVIRADISSAIAEVEKKHGIEFQIGRITYDPRVEAFHLRLDGARAGKDTYSVAWERFAEQLGFKPEWLGIEFRIGGHAYKLRGLTKTGKVVADRGDGKLYTYAHDAILSIIRIQQATPGARK